VPSVPNLPKGVSAAKTAPQAKGLSNADAKTFLDKQYGAWRDKLTPAQTKGMSFYQAPSGFGLMNGQLRGVDLERLKTTEHASDQELTRARAATKNLVSAIKIAPPLTAPVTVFRGFSADQFGKLEPGKTISDKAFVSVSLTDTAGAVSSRVTRHATATITLPPGTRAAGGTGREMVLPPGATFHITNVTTRGGSPHVTMEYVVPREKTKAVTASLLAKTDEIPVIIASLLDELDEDALTAANWVEKAGGLPQYIKRISKHLQEKGMDQSRAIATAVNVAKKMCASGDLNYPGLQKVNPGSRAEACAAVADWEAKKAKSHA
jgi:hypothetical protein